MEHDKFFASIRKGEPLKDAERGALSTLADNLGRMAVHSGRRIGWQEALNSDVVLVPDHLTFDSEAPVQPLENGHYPIPVPGRASVV